MYLDSPGTKDLSYGSRNSKKKKEFVAFFDKFDGFANTAKMDG